MGDVLLTWENEAFLAQQEIGKGKVQIVRPSMSILAEPPVALVDRYAERHGTQAAAKAYLDFLYTPEGQAIIAKHHYRPRNADVAARYASNFPQMEMLTIDKDFGGWKAAQQRFFSDGGVFDEIQKSNRR